MFLSNGSRKRVESGLALSSGYCSSLELGVVRTFAPFILTEYCAARDEFEIFLEKLDALGFGKREDIL